MFDLSAWQGGTLLWWVIDVAAVAVRALAMIHGGAMWRKRPQAPETIKHSDEATQRNHEPRHPYG
jgi:hypothetical protein